MNRAIFLGILLASLAVGMIGAAQTAPSPVAAPSATDNDARFQQNLRRWNGLSDAQKQRMRELYERWKAMPEAERERVRGNLERFRQLKENQQRVIVRARQMMERMHARTREDIRRRLGEMQQMPPDRRRPFMQKFMAIQSVMKEDWERLRTLPWGSPEARQLVLQMRVKGMILGALPPEEIERLKNLPPEERRREVTRLFEERRQMIGPLPEGGPHPPPPGRLGEGDGQRRPHFGPPRPWSRPDGRRPDGPPSDAPHPDGPPPDIPRPGSSSPDAPKEGATL